ncbi:MAG TPA: M13 family metallopeptidase [Xanthobacteraceae bacterium]|nr:M13 family metallopeptidase [Xanthobacteraceae bacterium]
MSSLVYRVAVLAISIVIGPTIGDVGRRAAYAAVGGWGFDLAGADFAITPGEDFFRYGNGAWYDHAVIPPDRSSIGVDTVLSITAEARIRDIVERGQEGVDLSAQADAAKFGAFYAAFMDEARAEALDAEPIAPLLSMIRASSTHDQLADLMGRRGFFFSIFGLGIGPDDKAPDRYAVSIRQGGLGLNRDYYVTPRLADKKAAYLAYIGELLAMIGWEVPAQSAAAILDFETAIAEVSWSNAERRDPEKTYNPTRVAALEEAAPFPWRALLASADLGGLDRVVVVENTAIPKIAALYVRAPLDTLKAWQAFHLIDGAAPYLSKRFVAANFEFRSRTMSGVAEQPPRWKRAVTMLNFAMGQAIGRVYVGRYFPPDAKAQIEELVGHLRIALKERITQLDWMSQDTKRKALDKLARLDVKIAYPDKWRDYSALEVRPDDLFGNMQASRKFAWLRQVNRLNSTVDRDDWYLSPHTVNASYNANLNEMTFPAGILQPPYFDPAADPAVNYGGIGAVIGHEMIHGFDDEGRKYDGAGVLSTWWTDADADQFVARAAVLGRQFDSYEPFPGLHLKGNLTMGENIADLGGALVALCAYHNALGGKPAPMIDDLSGDQRFFLSYAQSWRHKSTEDSIRQQVVSNPHAPAKYRVNGVVRNMDAWYTAFSIKAGDKLFLAPEDRVRIW